MTRIETVQVDGSPMEILIAEPDGPGHFPALVMGIHAPAHIGLEADEFTVYAAERYAKAGYVVAAPFLFHRCLADQAREDKMGGLKDVEILADTDAAFDLLRGMDRVDSGRVGVLGHCMGGRVAWLAATHRPDYAAAAVFWGGSLKLGKGEGAPPPIERAAHMPCPVAGFFGNDDANPSPQDVDDISAALTAAGKAHEFHRYDGAGHAFQDFSRPERYRKEASDDAWEKVLEFLANTL
jgi:carboxymethylenebutenolidase